MKENNYRKTESNPLIIFPNKIIKKFKNHVFVKVIFVLYRSVFQWPYYVRLNEIVASGCANVSWMKLDNYIKKI